MGVPAGRSFGKVVVLVLAVGAAVLGLGAIGVSLPRNAPGIPATFGESPAVQEPLLEGLPWFALAVLHPTEGSLAGFDLVAGVLGHDLTEVSPRYGPLHPSSAYAGGLPFAAGTFGEVVLYGYWNGTVSEIRALVPGTGVDRLVWRGPLIVHDAAMDARTEKVYFLSVDKHSRQPASVFRVDRAGLHVPHLVARLPAHEVDDVAAANADLALTPDGSVFVVLDCPIDCTLRWFDAADDGSAGAVALSGSFRLVGISDTTVWLVPECGDVPCPVTSVHLSTGAVSSIGTVCTYASVVQSSEDETVVSDGAPDTCVRDDYALVRFDAAGPVTIAAFPDRELALFEGRNQGFGTPEGWVLVGPNGRLTGAVSGDGSRSVLVRVADGKRLDLPDLDPNPR